MNDTMQAAIVGAGVVALTEEHRSVTITDAPASDARGPSPRRALVVCTANVCRSPVAERLLQRALDGLDRSARLWTVRSAGTITTGARTDRWTLVVASDAGLDISRHIPRRLDETVLATDGADLILAMTREHLRHVVALDPGAWPRTFTLKQLARRAAGSSADGAGDESFSTWRERMSDGRPASELMVPDDIDDIADPYGRSRRDHVAMMGELVDVVARLLRDVPWLARDDD
jgi:protein-tyrosine phosphatase